MHRLMENVCMYILYVHGFLVGVFCLLRQRNSGKPGTLACSQLLVYSERVHMSFTEIHPHFIFLSDSPASVTPLPSVMSAVYIYIVQITNSYGSFGEVMLLFLRAGVHLSDQIKLDLLLIYFPIGIWQ